MTSLLLATGHAAHPGRLLLALAPLLIVALLVDIYCIVDIVRAPSVLHLPKVVWALIAVCISFPIGALLYLFLGRVRDQGSKVPG